MEQTRVTKGERYWRIWAMDNHFEIRDSIDDYGTICNQMFAMGNYFLSKEQAETTARKLRAVLKGADVIEMPSEEELVAKPVNEFYIRPSVEQYETPRR